MFITQPVARSAIERLRSVAEVAWNPDAVHILTKDELLAAVRAHDILFCLLQDRVDCDVIAANADLHAVASMKITPSDIDVAAATARRIPVTVIPPIVTEATADLHFGIGRPSSRACPNQMRWLRRPGRSPATARRYFIASESSRAILASASLRLTVTAIGGRR